MARETREIFIGAAAMALLVVVLGYLYGGREAAARAAAQELHLDAVFNRVDGLVERDTVYLAGVRVGSVAGMRLDNNFRAVVTMKIDPAIKLPIDSTASIQTDGLFGSKFIVLEAGGEDDVMKSGHRIIFTEDAVVVGDLLDLIISEGKASQAKLRKAAGAAK